MIIIPTQTTKEVKCIVEGGVRYCEDKKLTDHQIGIVTLSIVGIILWFALWFWISSKIEEKYDVFPLIPIIMGGLVLPLLIIGTILITGGVK